MTCHSGKMLLKRNIILCGLFLAEFVLFFNAKKLDITKAASDLLEKEEKRLTKEDKNGCPLKLISFYNLKKKRFRQMPNPKVDLVSCTVTYLQNHYPEDGWMWSVLGDLYVKKGGKFNNLANTCFKQASKLSGKLTLFVKEWYFLGPFVIGKTEFDGDPVEFYGGIKNVSRFRDMQKEVYCSELARNGAVTWKEISAGDTFVDAPVKVTPKIDWNDLVSSLGSMGITEWQGWIVGEFAVNDKDVNVLVQCLGVHTVFVDDLMLTGDVYHRDKFWFNAPVSRGIHTIYIRLRTKVIQNFKCSLKIAPSTFTVLPPPFLPDLANGYLPSFYISIPISNLHSTKWLKDIRISVSSQSDNVIGSLKLRLLENSAVAIAPGQTRPINIELQPSEQPITNGCSDVKFEIKISTSEGLKNLPVNLRCRMPSESFLFTFVDHDGSIQHAAAIKPLKDCKYGTNMQTDVQTGRQIYPILLTLHGTTVPPQNQADSYKHMRDKEFVFGVPGAWILAPTRHGAHNWEGPGALTAMTALKRLSDLTLSHSWIEQLASATRVIFAGHSMGGHGAWHVATHFPDLALGLVSLAGWTKKEEYGESNLFFKHDISTSHTEPAVKSILEACIAENDADRFVSNLQGVPVLARIGANDRTVHPFFTRRMYRRLKEERIEVTYTELKDKEHWWWDTRETNDGGAVNDKQLRDFTERVACPLLKHEESSPDTQDQSCQTGDSCEENQQENKYTADSHLPPFENYTYSSMNPAFGGAMRGIKILQQITPYRMSVIKGKLLQGEILLSTVNVARFSLTEPNIRPVMWKKRTLKIDREFTVSDMNMKTVLDNENAHFCKIQGSWQVCDQSLSSLHTRGPDNLGPARRIAESKFIIITGTQGSESSSIQLLNYAVYIANLFYLTSDTFVPIRKDSETDHLQLDSINVIILGNTEENSLTAKFLSTIPIRVEKDSLSLESCHFDDPRTGLMTLTPNGDLHLAMVLMALSTDGMKDVVSLATPTIPPMTRSPFSNLLPDFVITGPEFGAKGPGGFLCAGFWGNNWEHRSDLSSCVC